MVPGILPDLSASEALDATRIYGVAGRPPRPRPLLRRPFRASHASITAATLLDRFSRKFPVPLLDEVGKPRMNAQRRWRLGIGAPSRGHVAQRLPGLPSNPHPM